MAKKQKKTDSDSDNKLIQIIGEALLEKKAEGIRVLDVRNITTVTDYFVICHATSDVQIKAIASNVMEMTKKNIGEAAWKREGMESNRWVVIDYVSVVVHIFLEELRNFYGLEKMWNDAIVTEIKDP